MWVLTKKDIKLTVRERFFLFMIAIPILATIVINVALGSLGQSNPSLAYYGSDDLASVLEGKPNIDLAIFDDLEGMLSAVERGDYDAGLVHMEETKLYVSGKSLLSERASVQSTVSSSISEMEGRPSLIDIDTHLLGEETYSLKVRFIPTLTLFSILISGFIISASMVEEREKKTINAILVSPVSSSEVIFSKTLYGLFLGVILGSLILMLHSSFTGVLVVPFLLLGTIFTVGLGLITGSVMDNITDLIARMKIFNMLLTFPALVILFPQIPGWIAKFFPTYYFIYPILLITQSGAGMGDLWVDMLVMVACDVIILAIAVKVLKERVLGRKAFI